MPTFAEPVAGDNTDTAKTIVMAEIIFFII